MAGAVAIMLTLVLVLPALMLVGGGALCVAFAAALDREGNAPPG